MKNFCLFFGIFCLIVAGIGFYLAETKYPNVTFAYCAIMFPFAVGLVSLGVYVEIRKKRPSD